MLKIRDGDVMVAAWPQGWEPLKTSYLGTRFHALWWSVQDIRKRNPTMPLVVYRRGQEPFRRALSD